MAPLQSIGLPNRNGAGALANTYLLETLTIDFDQNTIATFPVIAAVAGLRFVLTKVFLEFSGANTITFASGATNLTGPIDFIAGSYLELGNSDGIVWRGDQLNEAFNVTLAAAQQVAGYFNYVTISE